MSARHALVAGAGIGGLTTALRLSRAGWRVSVFEKAPVLEEAGAGLQLSPNASAVLRRLGVLDRLAEAALAPEAIRIRRAADGATLALLPIDDAERRWGAPYLLAHRADLQRALLEAVSADASIELRTGVEVLEFGATPEAMTVFLRAGSSRIASDGDCLICADGSRSLLRLKFRGDAGDDRRFAGSVAWRALVDSGSVSPDMRRSESNLWLGPGAHLVHYPLRGGTVVNVVAVLEEDSSVSDAQEFWSIPGDPKLIGRRFARWADSARNLIAAAPRWRKWPLFDRDPLPSWTKGRVALLGDAAHPVLPFLAQGAAQAIEDADALGEAFERAPTVEAGLASYGATRRPRATRVQKEARAQAIVYHLGGPAALARDLALRALGGRRLLARYDWLYDTRGARADM